ncbi:MAG: exodeoxyribonuclease III [Succinivibrio sp.]|nr:exodeoxyribonuclease III [Succinivibrio sp.]
MKILSWNVNGLMAAYGHGLAHFLEITDYDIYAFQETKTVRCVQAITKPNYVPYWSSDEERPQYSGTMVMSRYKARNNWKTLGELEFNEEGRIITLDFPEFYFLNLYMPNSQHAADRVIYRREFDLRLFEYVRDIIEIKPVILCGDMNTTLGDLDVYDENERAHRAAMFESMERTNLKELMGLGLCDVFRHLHPQERGGFTWWSARQSLRSTNQGWRLDYFFVDERLMDRVKGAEILSQVLGSDHCPVTLDIDLQLSPVPAGRIVKTWDAKRIGRLRQCAEDMGGELTAFIKRKNRNEGNINQVKENDLASLPLKVPNRTPEASESTGSKAEGEGLWRTADGKLRLKRGPKSVSHSTSDPDGSKTTEGRGAKTEAPLLLIQDGNLSNSELGTVWDAIDWAEAEHRLALMQKELSLAAADGRGKHKTKIRELQEQIVDSPIARALAVRRVTSRSKGPGIDKVKWGTPREKMSAALSLSAWRDYEAQPARIFKTVDLGGKERSFHVCTWYDRAMQELFSYALDPVAEAWSDLSSYAYRKGHSAADANEKIKWAFSGEDKALFAFVGDVRQCFESISHQFVMKRIPLDKHVLREFLRAGYFINGQYFPPDSGVGIGCIISPIIANMVMDGLQGCIYRGLNGDHQITDYKNGKLVRYADDILVSARDLGSAYLIRDLVRDFLKPRGLELNEDKSYIAPLEKGFDFLSRRYELNREVLFVHPSAKSVESFKVGIEHLIRNNTDSEAGLIRKINKKIDAWSAYHRYDDSLAVFRTLDDYIRGQLIAMCMEKFKQRDRRIKHVPLEKIEQKYFYRRGGDGLHCFTVPGSREISVKFLRDTVLVQHRAPYHRLNPYIDREYLEKREKLREIQNATGQFREIWDRQEGRCYYCGRRILPDQERTVIDVLEGFSQKTIRAYVHCGCLECGYDCIETDTQPQSATELGALMDKFDRGRDERVKGQKFLPLHDFFRHCGRKKVSLTFYQIEELLRSPLGKAAEDATWWLKRGFSRISHSWRDNGYEISELSLRHHRISFVCYDKSRQAAHIPEVLLSGRLPPAAKAEIEAFTKDLVKRFGLSELTGSEIPDDVVTEVLVEPASPNARGRRKIWHAVEEQGYKEVQEKKNTTGELLRLLDDGPLILTLQSR